MLEFLLLFLRCLFAGFQSQSGLVLENLALRHQLAGRKRQARKPKPRSADRLLWVGLRCIWPLLAVPTIDTDLAREAKVGTGTRVRDEHTGTSEPARVLAAGTSNRERTLSDLVNQAYGLTPAEIEMIWQTEPPRMPIPPPCFPQECRSQVNPRSATRRWE